MKEWMYAYRGVTVSCKDCMNNAIKKQYGPNPVGWQATEWTNDNGVKGINTDAPCQFCNKRSA
jgi:hypothetical protein